MKRFLLICSFLLLCTPAYTHADYEWVPHALPNGNNDWSDIDISDDGTKVVAVASNEYIHISDDGGTTWTNALSAGSGAWSAVTMSADGTILFAARVAGRIYKSTDGGDTWATTSAGSGSWSSLATSDDGTYVLASLASGYMYLSSNSGNTWTQLTSPGAKTWKDLAVSSNGQKMVAVPQSNYIYTSDDYGVTWTAQTNSGSRVWRGVSSSDDGTIIFASVSSSGYVYKSADSGVTWTSVTTSYGAKNWYGISCSSDCSRILGVTTVGYIYVSPDGGTTWNSYTALGTKSWNQVAYARQSGSMFAIETLGKIYGSLDGGTSWTSRPMDGLHDWKAIAMSADGSSIVALTFLGSIFTTMDSGVTWIESTTLPAANWRAVDNSSDGNRIVIGGQSTYLYVSTDGGVTWATSTSSGSRNWYGVTMSDNGMNVAAVVSGGYIYTSSDGGVNWTQQTGSGSRNWREIAGSADGTKLTAAVNAGYVYTSTDSGVTWTAQTQPGTQAWVSITSSDDFTKQAAARVVSIGPIYLSTDSGVTWASTTNDAGSNAWVSIRSSGDGTKLIIADNGGYIYTSSDSGIHWTTHTGPGNIGWQATAISKDGQHMAAGDGADGYLYMYELVIDIPIVSTASSTSIHSTTQLLYGSLDNNGGESVSQHGFEYTTSPTFADNVYTTTEGALSSGEFTSNVSGLLCSTVYYYRAYAENSAGIGRGGTDSFVTGACPPSVATSTPTSVSTTSATLNASIIDDGGASSTERGFEWGTTTLYGYVASTTGIFGIGAFSEAISNLSCDTTYHYRGFALNSEGIAYTSDDIFNTSDCPAPPPVEEPQREPEIRRSSSNSRNTTVLQTTPTTPSTPMTPTTPIVPVPIPITDENDIDGGVSQPVQSDQDSVIPGESGGMGEHTRPDGTVRNSNTKSYSSSASITRSIGGYISSATHVTADMVRKVYDRMEDTSAAVADSAVVKVTSAAGITAGVVAVTPVIFSSPIAVSEIIFIPVRLWGLLLMGLGLRKRLRPWGTVYDSVTKRPVDPAYVTVTDMSGNVVAESLTDIDGRYGFLLPKGTYIISAKKSNYIFPSHTLKGAYADEMYRDLYYGTSIEVEDGAVIDLNIPMDPVDFDWNEFVKHQSGLMTFHSNRERIWRILGNSIFRVGLLLTMIATLVQPQLYNIITLILYLIVYCALAFGIKKKAFGHISFDTSNTPASFAIVRVFTPDGMTLISSRVADMYGRYYCLVPKGSYRVVVETKQQDGSYRLAHDAGIIHAKNGIIQDNFIM